MKTTQTKLICLLLTALFFSCCGRMFAGTRDVPNFNDHIKPIFRSHCLTCHNADDAESDVDLSTFAAVLRGGSSGAIVKPGQPDSSLLYMVMSHHDDVEAMPPEKPRIPDAELGQIEAWIRGGLLEGAGAKSLLRNIAMADPSSIDVSKAPMPETLKETALTKTIRPPVPQAIAASPGAPLFAVSGELQIQLFTANEETAGYARLGVLPFPEGTIHDLKFSRNGAILIASGGRGAHSGSATLFDVATGTKIGQIGDEVDSVFTADITSDHRHVALGGSGKFIKIFDVKSGKVVHKIEKHTDWITSLSFSPDGKLLASGDRSGGVHVWETDKGAIVFSLTEHKVQITDLAWRSDGKLLATVAEDGNMIFWDIKDGWPAKNIVAHGGKQLHPQKIGVLSASFAPDGSVLTTGRDSKFGWWKPDGSAMARQDLPALPIQSAFLAGQDTTSSDGSQRAVFGLFDGQVIVFDLKANKTVQVLNTGR